jgi:DNA-binding MarR family transcriptional regulator
MAVESEVGRDATQGDDAETHADVAAPDARTSEGVRLIVFLAREFERACQETSLSLPQFRLLLFLRDGPRRAGELAARVAIKRPTLTALVAGLEREDYIDRAAVEKDGRGIHIELTDRGAEAVEQTNRELSARLSALMDLSATDSRNAVLDAIHHLTETMDAEIEKRTG